MSLAGDVVGVREAGYLLSPLEVVDRTAPGRQEELRSAASPVTMIWLVTNNLSISSPFSPFSSLPLLSISTFLSLLFHSAIAYSIVKN